MELYAGAALSGLGYMLTQERDSLKQSLPFEPLPAQHSSMTDVYNSQYYTESQRQEEELVRNKWALSQDPRHTGVVPRPAYADMFSRPEELENPAIQRQPAASASPERFVSMAGYEIKPEQFTHNNMQPYYRGQPKQTIDVHNGESRLEHYTGRSDLFHTKKACASFGDVQPSAGNVLGMPGVSEFYQDRIQLPVAQNNVFPIAQIRVGPGLNQGYTSTPSGGFQQSLTNDIARPKTVNELRPGNKPKLVYENPTPSSGKAFNTARTLDPNVAKNRVDTFYEQTPEQWLKTTGLYTAAQDRPEQVVKPTSRVETHVEYEGLPTKSVSEYGRGEKDDYGKASVCIYDNERQTTQTKTVISNATSVIKALTAPFLDFFRHTPKEYTVDSARTFGSMQAQIPSKPTTYDPVNHVMRTTIKETTIHDTTIANPRGPNAAPVQNEQEARTTTRETLPLEDTTRNVSAHVYKTVVYDPEVVSRTTIRQTTSENPNQQGYVGEGAKKHIGAYSHIPVDLTMTERQFTADYEYYGAGGARDEFRLMSKEADYNAEIDGTREWINIESSRAPTGQGAKVPFSKEGVDMEVKKLMSDAMAPRDVPNPTRVYQPGPVPIENCEATKGTMALPNANAGRLDPGVLESLKANPFNLAINPIGTGVPEGAMAGAFCG
jgi:hypothetical protein